MVAMLALAAALGPVLVRIDPLAIDLTHVLAPPSRGHLARMRRAGARHARASAVGRAALAGGFDRGGALSLATGGIVGGAAALAGGRVDRW